MPCDDLGVGGRVGWGRWGAWDGEGGVGGKPNRQGIYICIEPIHCVVQQELTQHCKEIILQFFFMHIIEKAPKMIKQF